MIISVFELLGAQPILAGALDGRRLFTSLVSSTPVVSQPTPLFIDFSGVTVATGSYLRESVVAYRDYVREALPYLYPVVANAAPPVLEEFEHLLLLRGDTMIVCEIGKQEQPSGIRVVGRLDKAQTSILDAVRRLGEIDARTVSEQFDQEKIGITAWNNRLASLVAKGLLIESRHGRSKSYRLALHGI